MPRGNDKRANSRPNVDTGGRPAFTRGGIVDQRPGRGNQRAAHLADALTRVSQTATESALRQQQEAEAEDAKQAKAQAYADYHADAQADVAIEQAREREQFQDDAYQDQYMRLHYSQQAKNIADDVRSRVRDMSDDPDADPEEIGAYIDATVSGALAGQDDPVAVEVLANRLTSEATEMKTQVQEHAIQEQRRRGVAALNAFVDDAASNSVLGSHEGIDSVLSKAADLDISQSAAKASITNALIRHALKEKDPTVLKALTEDRADGASFVDDPELRQTILDAQAKASELRDNRRTADDLRIRYQYESKAQNGALTRADMMRLDREHPDIFSQAQLANMAMQSKRRRQQIDAERQAEASARSYRRSVYADPGKAGIELRKMSASDRQEVIEGHYRASIEGHPDTAEGRADAFVQHAEWLAQAGAAGSGLQSDRLKAMLDAGAMVPSEDGSMPDQFRRGWQVWRTLNSDPRTRGLAQAHTSDEAERRYRMMDAEASTGGFDMHTSDGEESQDFTRSYANVIAREESAVSADDFRGSDAAQKIQTRVDSIDDVGTLWGNAPMVADGPGRRGGSSNSQRAIRRFIKKNATRYARYGYTADEAIQMAADTFRENHTAIKGTYFRTNGTHDDAEATKMVDVELERRLPAIREYMGDPDIGVDDLMVQPVPTSDPYSTEVEMQVVPTDGISPVMEIAEDGHTRPARFTLGDAAETYRHRSLEEYRRELDEAQTDAKREAERPEPAPGSPRTVASKLDESNRDSREAARKWIGDTASSIWDSVTASMAEAREKDANAVGPMGRRQ